MALLPSFSKARALLILLGAAIFSLSAATLGLAAHCIAYYLNATERNIKYVNINVYGAYNTTDNTTAHYTTNLVYDPGSGLDMSDLYGLLMTGILGTLLGLPILIASLHQSGKESWKVNISLSGRTVRPVDFLGAPITFLLQASLLLTFVATSGYSWTQASQSWSWVDTVQLSSDDASDNYVWYNGNDPYTFEYWNFALAMIATSNAKNPSGGQLYALCQEARVARVLGLVLFVLVVVRLGVHYWAWRRRNVAVRLARAKEQRYVEGYAEGARESKRLSSTQSSRHGKGLSDAVELPSYRMSRVEATGDTMVREMPGDDGTKEVEAETVAYELDGECCKHCGRSGGDGKEGG